MRAAHVALGLAGHVGLNAVGDRVGHEARRDGSKAQRDGVGAAERHLLLGGDHHRHGQPQGAQNVGQQVVAEDVALGVLVLQELARGGGLDGQVVLVAAEDGAQAAADGGSHQRRRIQGGDRQGTEQGGGHLCAAEGVGGAAERNVECGMLGAGVV